MHSIFHAQVNYANEELTSSGYKFELKLAYYDHYSLRNTEIDIDLKSRDIGRLVLFNDSLYFIKFAIAQRSFEPPSISINVPALDSCTYEYSLYKNSTSLTIVKYKTNNKGESRGTEYKFHADNSKSERLVFWDRNMISLQRNYIETNLVTRDYRVESVMDEFGTGIKKYYDFTGKLFYVTLYKNGLLIDSKTMN